MLPSTVQLDRASYVYVVDSQIFASVARRNSRGDSAVRKNRICASAVENWSTALRGSSVVVVFAHFFLLFLYNTYVY